MRSNTEFVSDYLRALSGHAKTPELAEKYVSDPKLTRHIAETEEGFPKYEILAEDILEDGDKVVVRGTFRGTHLGPLQGVAPTGKQVSAGLIIIYRLENGRIADHWMQFDLFGLLGQLQPAVA